MVFCLAAHFSQAQIVFAEVSNPASTEKPLIASIENSHAYLEDCPVEEGMAFSKCSLEKLASHLNDKIKFPALAKEHMLEERCEVFLRINPKGELSEFILEDCNAQIFRKPILKALEELKFHARIYRGQAVSQALRIHVDFTLD